MIDRLLKGERRRKAIDDLRALIEDADREGGKIPAEEVRKRLLARYDRDANARRISHSRERE